VITTFEPECVIVQAHLAVKRLHLTGLRAGEDGRMGDVAKKQPRRPEAVP